MISVTVMKWCCLIAIFSLCVPSQGFIQSRNVHNFAQLIANLTGRNPFDYLNYGNWCGFGGSGKPKDDLDACCMRHDKCYSHVGEECLSLIYVYPYNWTVKNGEILCAQNENKCGIALCECDKIAAECFAANKYHLENWTPLKVTPLLKAIWNWIAESFK